MYKTQMKLQKILCLLAILASALVFIYSLGLMTDLYDSLYGTMTDPSDLTKTTVPGSIIYYDMQGFNNTFMKAGLCLILLSCLLFATNTHSRRKYYVGNFVSVALQAIANVAVAVWAHGQIVMYRAQFLEIDFGPWPSMPSAGRPCTPSPPSGSTCTTPCSVCCWWSPCCWWPTPSGR